MFFLFGQKYREVGTYKTEQACPHCEHGRLHVILYRGYVHLFWIPMFPFGRAAYMWCDHCKWLEEVRNLKVEVRTQEDRDHNDTMKATLKLARTPIWYWTGLVVFSALILLALLVE